jgi:hypothetical protein
MTEHRDNRRRRVRLAAMLSMAVLASIAAQPLLGQAKNRAIFVPSKASSGLVNPHASRPLTAHPMAETGTTAANSYYMGVTAVNGTYSQQVISFSTLSASASYVPTVGLQWGKNYSVGAVNCTQTYDPTDDPYDPYIETCTVTVTFTPLYPGGHRDAIYIFDSDGKTHVSGAFLYGIGQAPQLMIQPGVSTSVVPSGYAYLYGDAVDDAGTFYVYSNSSFYTIKNGVAALLVSSVDEAIDGLSIDGAGNLFDAGSGQSSGYEYEQSNGNSWDAALCHTIAGVLDGTIDYLPFTTCFYRTYGAAAGNLGTFYEVDGGGEQIYWTSSATYASGLLAASYGTEGPVVTPGQVGNEGSWGYLPNPFPFNNGNYGPPTIVVDAYENLYFSDPSGGHGITRWCDWGGLSGPANGCAGSSAMTQLTTTNPGVAAGFSVDAAETLYVSTSSGVWMLSPTNNYASPIATIGVSGFPSDSAIGPDGTFFVNSAINDSVYIFDRSQGLVDFGTNNGDTSNPYTMTLYNGGNEALTLGSIAVDATGTASGFTMLTSATSPCSNGIVLAAGTICEFQISYAPAHKGTLSGAVTITSNSLNTTGAVQTIALTGTQPGIYVTLSPSTLSFGYVAPGGSSTLPVSLINTSVPNNSVGYGSSTIINSSFTSSNPAFTVTPNTCSSVEATGTSCSIQVTFNPTTAQDFTGTTITWQEAISGGGPTQNESLTVNGTSILPGHVLTITANNATRAFLANNPTYSYTPSGFVNGDTAAVLSGAPVYSPSPPALNAPAGTYPINIAQGTLAAPSYYALQFVPGTLTVLGNVPQLSLFPPLPTYISMAVGNLTLVAHSSSGLPISYTVSGPATLSGYTLTLTGTGTVTVSATQGGNTTFNPATTVVRTFTVTP